MYAYLVQQVLVFRLGHVSGGALHLIAVLELVAHIGQQQLHDVAHHQARAEDGGQVDGQAGHAGRAAAVAHALCDKGEVEEGGVRVHELEQEDLRDHAIFELHIEISRKQLICIEERDRE